MLIVALPSALQAVFPNVTVSGAPLVRVAVTGMLVQFPASRVKLVKGAESENTGGCGGRTISVSQATLTKGVAVSFAIIARGNVPEGVVVVSLVLPP